MKKHELKQNCMREVLYNSADCPELNIYISMAVESIMGRPVSLTVKEEDGSATALEYYGHRVDVYVVFEGDDLRQLADKFQAKDDKSLLKKLKERFAPYKMDARSELMEFCDKKGIKYNQIVY